MSVVDGDLRESFLETVEEQLGAALAERGLAGETGLGDHAESSLRRVAIRRALELCHMLTIEGRPFRWCFPRRGA